MNKKELKLDLISAYKKLKKLGMLPGVSGNLSMRFGNTILITPTGIGKENLKPKNISEIDINGKILNKIKPSSEYLLHIFIYNKRKDIKSIVHSHPPYALSYSITKTKVDYDLTVEFKMVVKNIAFCPFKKPGSKELAKTASKKIKNSNVLLLENHGLVCVSDNVNKAVDLTEEVENFFKINFLVSILKNNEIIKNLRLGIRL